MADTSSPAPSHPITNTPTTPPTPTQTFHQFPNLPYELRIKIFNHILAIPRVVNVAYITKTVVTPAHENKFGNRVHYPIIPASTRYVNSWTSFSKPPVALGICKESRELALKIYKSSLGLPDRPSRIFINFAVDILYFGDASITPCITEDSTRSITCPLHQPLQEPAPYRLDLFLMEDDYHGANLDIKQIRYLAIDVAEELYGRRSFCWDTVRSFPVLERVILIAWEEDEDVAVNKNGTTASPRERCMRSYHNSLTRVWEKYLKGYGEGLVSKRKKGKEQVKEEMWQIPRIEVYNAFSGNFWGEVTLPKGQ